MSKRTPIDLTALTSLTATEATTMPEATQRSPSTDKPSRVTRLKEERPSPIQIDDSASLNFKVTPAFKERYRLSAAKARLKLNELLFEALEAWDEKKK